jgi:hypothetical protein
VTVLDTTAVTAAVAAAVTAVETQFTDHSVEVLPDGTGGAVVIIGDVDVGDRYNPSTTWLGFQVSAAYPAADVYPHYVGRVVRQDGQPHGPAIQQVTWRNRPALQLSRRSNGWNPALDNAALKAEKVIMWLVTQ